MQDQIGQIRLRRACETASDPFRIPLRLFAIKTLPGLAMWCSPLSHAGNCEILGIENSLTAESCVVPVDRPRKTFALQKVSQRAIYGS